MFNQSKKECNTQVKRNYDNDFCVRYLVTLKSMCRSALSNQYEGTRRADSIPMISANQLALPLVVGREYDLDSQSSVDEIAFDISLIEDVVIGIHGYN